MAAHHPLSLPNKAVGERSRNGCPPTSYDAASCMDTRDASPGPGHAQTVYWIDSVRLSRIVRFPPTPIVDSIDPVRFGPSKCRIR